MPIWNQKGVYLGNRPNVSYYVTSGLQLYLDAGNTASYPGTGTTWTDLSGNGNNGTLTNGPTFSSSNGGSIVFDGSNDYVTVPFSANFPTGSSARTLCAFLNASTVSGGRSIFGIGGNTSAGCRSNLWIENAGTIGIETLGNGVFTSSWAGINNWVYLCVTYAAGGNSFAHTLYINGSQVSTSTVGSAATMNTLNTSCFIGTIPNAVGNNHFSGNISIVQLYNRVLTAVEVSQNFNAVRGRYGL